MRAADPEVVGAVLDVLRGHQGKENAIPLAAITCLVREMLFPERPGQRRVEEAVSYLRTHTDMGVIGSSKGICLAATVEEANEGIRFQRRYAMAALGSIRGLKRARLRLAGQTRMEAA